MAPRTLLGHGCMHKDLPKQELLFDTHVQEHETVLVLTRLYAAFLAETIGCNLACP